VKETDQDKLETANKLCREGGLPELTQAEFDRYYSVNPLCHGVNTQSPTRSLEAQWMPGRLAAMRLAILWHEGSEALVKAERLAEIIETQIFEQFLEALPKVQAASARLRELVSGD
jgi:hypothetical protein